jgi:hypothetical protein
MSGKHAMRMSYDRNDRLKPITTDEFDAARAFMITNVRLMMEHTPIEAGEARREYVERVQRKVLLLQDRPQVIVDMQRDRRDFTLAKLGDPDAPEEQIQSMRALLEGYNNGTVDGRESFSRLMNSVDPKGFAAAQRAILEQRLSNDKRLLNRHDD